jgi:2-polyprenyl-3-methyl-5-hydroxy-6-metoxy-1,4-benzoquinol methylase
VNSGDFVYVGTELDLFAKAENWKRYFTQFIRPYIAESVLEVGAGMGASTRALWHSGVERWICLEPDAGLCRQLEAQCAAGELPAGCEARAGSLQDLPADDRFGTILYIDVLEHIEDDQQEVRRAAEHLHAGGYLVVLAPAHNWLFSPFDQAVGHFRRYSRPALLELGVAGLRPVAARYLDSVGMLASMANRVLLRASTPSVAQIVFWDRFMVPCSRLLDPLLAYSLGKTVVVVWQRQS